MQWDRPIEVVVFPGNGHSFSRHESTPYFCQSSGERSNHASKKSIASDDENDLTVIVFENRLNVNGIKGAFCVALFFAGPTCFQSYGFPPARPLLLA